MMSHTQAASDEQVAFREEVAIGRLVAIVRGPDSDAALATVLALAAAGVRLVEVSLTTPDALSVIRSAAESLASGSLGSDGSVARGSGARGSGARGSGARGSVEWRIGAGTVRTADDVRAVLDAGATFAVTPGLGAGVHACLAAGLPVLAGAYTASEAMAAAAAGVAGVKLFPAGIAGGPRYLRALRDPLPDIPFVPVGGVDTAAAAEYLAAGAIAVGVGTPLIGDAVTGGDLDALKSRAARFLAAVAGGPES